MDAVAIKQQLLRFRGARGTLLLVVVFTTVNLFLAAFGTSFYMLFSATVPQIFLGLGLGLADEFQNNIFLIAGATAAFAGVFLYLLCWSLANRYRVFILFALVLFSIDTLVCVAFVFIGGFDLWYLVEIAFHVWILFGLVNGVIAWAKLRDVNPDDLSAVMKEMANKPRGV